MTEMKECVVIDCVRTPIGKSSRAGLKKTGGAFRTCSAQDLLLTAMEAVVDRVQAKAPDFDLTEIEDCAVGCLSQIGEQAGNIGRLAVSELFRKDLCYMSLYAQESAGC